MKLKPSRTNAIHQIYKNITITFFVLIALFSVFFVPGCGLNPIPVPNVISGSNTLFAPRNDNATFIFSGNGTTYGSFQLQAYVTTASLMTPHGGGIQKSSQNLSTAPESGYSVSEECGYYYYYMITDMELHYAKVFIHTIEQSDEGISIDFNWWVQTQAGERNF